MRRSRESLTAKLHALVDARGLPIRILASGGQACDGQHAFELKGYLNPGTVLLADRAYDSNSLRRQIAECSLNHGLGMQAIDQIVIVCETVRAPDHNNFVEL